MSKIQRFNSFVGGLFTVLFGVVLFLAPYIGTDLIIFVMSCSLILLGVGKLLFYATMSRHMVGGKYSLFYGLILTDLGVVAFLGMLETLGKIPLCQVEVIVGCCFVNTYRIECQ